MSRASWLTSRAPDVRYVLIAILILLLALAVIAYLTPRPRVSPESDSGSEVVELMNLAQFKLSAAQDAHHKLWRIIEDDPKLRPLARETAERLQDCGAALGRAIDAHGASN